MACSIDLYQRPDLLGNTETLIQNLETQVRIVKALERSKERLASGTSLDPTSLNRCASFVGYFNNGEKQSNFVLEVSKLSLDELAFCAITFSERLLKQLLGSFKALQIMVYMRHQNIRCTGHPEIYQRLKYLSRTKAGRFLEFSQAERTGSIYSKIGDPNPTTSAEAPESWEMGAASWESIRTVAGDPIMEALPFRQSEFSTHIRSRYARTRADAVTSFELESEKDWVHRLFPGSGAGASVDTMETIFAPNIKEAMKKSELWKWERRNGYTDTTECIELAYCIKIRTAYTGGIANALHSDVELSTVYNH